VLSACFEPTNQHHDQTVLALLHCYILQSLETSKGCCGHGKNECCHVPRIVNTEVVMAANKSVRSMVGPPDTLLLHVCGPPRPVVANHPSSGACCVGLGHGQWGTRSRGSRGQPRVTYQWTHLMILLLLFSLKQSLVKPWPALAMDGRCDEGPNCRALHYTFVEQGMADGR